MSFSSFKKPGKKKLRECQQSHKCRHRAIVAYKYAIHIYQQNDNIKRIIVERLIGDAEKLLMSLRELYIESSTTVMPCINNKEKKGCKYSTTDDTNEARLNSEIYIGSVNVMV